jgi:hypothetical protein
MSINESRKQIRPLVDDSNPADSPSAYYALFHPAEKSALATYQTPSGKTTAFAGRFQTGVDLFRPLVTLRAPSPDIAAYLLAQLLVVGRPYIFFAPLNQLAMVGGSLEVENQRIARIYTLEPARFSPQMNVLIQHKTAHDGTPRCEIKSNGQVVASAGVSWKSPAFAEIYVQALGPARQKGMDQAVLGALAGVLLNQGLRAVYLAENGEDGSRAMVESLGFVDTGSRQVYADTVYMGNPSA